MGACYSKNTAGTETSSENKRPKHKHRDSSRSGKGNVEDPKQNDKHLEKPALMNDTISEAESRLFILDAEVGHINEKLMNSGVVPSDSGIESIDTVPDDLGESAQLKEKEECSKTLENPSSGSGQKTGSHGLSLSEERKGEEIIVISHGAQNGKDSTTTYNHVCHEHDISAKNGTATVINALTNGSHSDFIDCKCKQSLQSSDSSNKDGSMCAVSECGGSNSNVNQGSMTSLKGVTSLQSDTSNETSTSYRAPLAAFDSIEANLNESSIHLNEKRQSLLSEILDLTESLCKCDFYSNENCSRDHGVNGAVTGLHHNGHSSEIGASGQFEKISERLNQIDQIAPYKSKPLSGSSSTSASQMSSTPSRKLTSLPKNVSFAAHEHISTGPASGAAYNNHLDPSSFILSSDTYSHRTASEIIFPNKQKDLHKRSASLGSVKATASDSSSDVQDSTREDDIASLDLDNISRVTSLSYNSIRQLVESTENLVSTRYIAQSVTIDGVDSVVIPKDVYRQMQTDLAILRQQLVYLSSLMQEGAVDMQDQ